VGDIIQVEKGERIPADLVLLQTGEDQGGSCYIRTDQLDGETDWKLRLPILQKEFYISNEEETNWSGSILYAEKPQRDIHSFLGTFTKVRVSPHSFW